MRVPRSRGEEGLRRVVRLYLESYTVTRRDDTKGRFGESQPGTTTHSADMWLFAPNNSPLETEYGDRITGDLHAISLPGADVQHADEVTHGGNAYHIQDPFHIPNESNQVLKVFGLERKTN